MVDLAVALHAAGKEVEVACATGGSLLHELEAERIPVRVLTGRRVKRRVGLRFTWKLRQLVKSDEYDLVHAHLYASSVAACLATIGTRCVRVITVHSEALWQGRAAGAISGRVYRAADAVVAVSDQIAAQLVRRHGIKPDRTVVIANALYRPAPPNKWPERSAPRAGPVIGAVCRLHRDKGVDVLLAAMALIARRHAEVHTVVVGDGPHGGRLKRSTRTLGLSDRVTFLGATPAARSLLPSFDLLVVPSRTEGSPLIVLEAMAAGVPVVASRVGGIPDQIRHGVEGLLVPADDPLALADAIERLLSDPVLSSSLAGAGKRRVSSCFQYADVLDAMERVYAAAQVTANGRLVGSSLKSAKAPFRMVPDDLIRISDDVDSMGPCSASKHLRGDGT